MATRRQKVLDKQRRKADLKRRAVDRREAEWRAREEAYRDRLLEEAGIDPARVKNGHARRGLGALTAIDRILTFMSLGRGGPLDASLAEFEGAIPLLPLTFETPQFKALKYGEAPAGRWKVSMATQTPDFRVEVVRCRIMDPAEHWKLFRSADLVGLSGKQVAEVLYATVDDSGRAVTRLDYFDHRPDAPDHGRYICVGGPADVPGRGRITTGGVVQMATGPLVEPPESVLYAPSVGQGMAVTLERGWSVGLRYPGHVGLRLPADPTAVRHMFAHRDVPAGRTRRQALLHWVATHWRADRHNPEDEVYVRRHLRGGRGFDWFGMDCEVHAPLDDGENDRLRAERAAMGRDEARRPRP